MTRVSSILFWFGLTLIVSLALYGTSNRVQEMGKQLRSLNAKIEAEQANIHVLKAEWVYLSNPARIEAAARKYLAMHPTAMKQIAKLEDLPAILPIREETNADVDNQQRNIVAPRKSLADRPVASYKRGAKVAAQNDTTHVNTHMILTETRDTAAIAVSAEPLPVHDSNFMMAADSIPSASPPP